MKKVNYYLSPENEFVIENYNQAPTFASFFPGIAGLWGCPMWTFYANRGQCLTSAGVQNKDNAIIEFQPANKAYRFAALHGFRTFVKVDGAYFEPFSEDSKNHQEMRIRPDSLLLIEENKKLKVRVETLYFTVPNESFPALARSVKVINLGSKTRKIELLDGLPLIIPFGFVNDLLKRMSQTIAAWVQIDNLGRRAPFYRLKVKPADVCETSPIEKGNFYLPFSSHGQVGVVIDPKIIFGEQSNLFYPDNFLKDKFIIPSVQITEGRLPAAFAHKSAAIGQGKELVLYTLVGQAHNQAALNKIQALASNAKYFQAKYEENRAIIADIAGRSRTQSSSQAFDLYSEYNFLDNTLRGGLPVSLGDKTMYLYYRKHGDMERDYNDFQLLPTYFSQGDGNYRDINQNRRSSLFFNPAVGPRDIRRFLNLIQLDGYNPLIVRGSRLQIKSPAEAAHLVKKHFKTGCLDLTQPFILGLLLKMIEEQGIEYKTSRQAFVGELLAAAAFEEQADHGEGFWIDHFSYNTDLLESFEAIYPERVKTLLFDDPSFTFYDNDHVVLPRSEKFCLACGLPRQYGAVQVDQEKHRLGNKVVKTKFGRGDIYRTTLAAKLLTLIANKAASFDAAGIGLEMEADKPDWYDALNGLPGLCGSSLSETLELKRLAVYLLDRLPPEKEIKLPVEVKDFVQALNEDLTALAGHFYWEAASQAKEDYRRKTRLGVSGKEVQFSSAKTAEFLKNVVKKCDSAVSLCLKKYHHYCTYFINEIAEYKQLENNKLKVRQFKQHPLPLFLEGFVHALKVEKDKRIFQQVRQSPLYDRKLKMYRVNAPLGRAPLDIGRCKVFTPGWLENESVWLHMEYKYLLELLRAGQYDEFFADFKQALIPFLKPEVYGRSILENSSFIVSAGHPDKTIHGRGFYARLSGACAEFVEIWLLMMTGGKPFSIDKEGRLNFALSPKLPGWLFKKGTLSFRLFGSIDVTYLNPKNKDTFRGLKPAGYKLTLADGKEVEIKGAIVPESYASQIREQKIKRIEVKLA